MEPRTGIFAEALAAALSLPGEEEAFFEALHKQAVSGKVVIAKMLANTLNENPTQGLRSRLVAFLKEKARVAKLVFAVLKHIRKGNGSYARLAIKQFPLIERCERETYEFLRNSRSDACADRTLVGAAA